MSNLMFMCTNVELILLKKKTTSISCSFCLKYLNLDYLSSLDQYLGLELKNVSLKEAESCQRKSL